MGETTARMGRKGNVYTILVRKFKEILQAPRLIRDDNIKVDFNKTFWQKSMWSLTCPAWKCFVAGSELQNPLSQKKGPGGVWWDFLVRLRTVISKALMKLN